MSRPLTLVELLDRLLAKGVVVWGDLTLAVADIDLVQLELRTLLASTDTVRSIGSRSQRSTSTASQMRLTAAEPPKSTLASAPASSSSVPGLEPLRRPPRERTPGRIDADPEDVARGLAQLVLTLVDLLRELMERQALRRVEGGTLDDEQVERLGTAFMKLQERMQELKDEFGLTDEDLNLNLGPLGDLT